MTKLYLIRHGVTEWNQQNKIQGHTNIPLLDEEKTVLQTLSPPYELRTLPWYSSPLDRALDTAHLLSDTQVTILPELIEACWGQWEGRSVTDLRADLGDEMLSNEARGLDFCPPDGESPRQVQNRLHPLLGKLKTPSVWVSHKGVLRALMALAYDWDMMGKAPAKFARHAAHAFDVTRDQQGVIKVLPVEMNMAFVAKQTGET
jgi:broad specificity phosphatase PhoE